MKNDQGFSLIELLIIVAIISILVGMVVVKGDVIFSYNAQEANKKVVSTLSTGKVQVLSKSKLVSSNTSVKTGTTVNPVVEAEGVYIEFFVEGNSIYTKTYDKGTAIGEKAKIGSKGVVLSIKLDDNSEEVLTGGEGEGIMFSFDRSTGAFLPYKDGKYVKEIHVSGGRREYIIKLMPKTGKVVKHGSK